MIDAEVQKKLRETFNPDDSPLRKQQLKLLEIMKVIDKICRKNNIDYWIGSGTLLGAVRHGGFIPWDDDLDIDIMYKDKKRFIEACERELPANMHVQYDKTDPSYFNSFLKIRDESTPLHQVITLEGKDYELDEKYKGLFVDVFTEEFASPFFVKLCNYLFDKCIVIYYARDSKWRAQLHYRLCKMVASFVRLIPFIKSKEYLFNTYGGHFNKGKKYSNIFPLCEISFEGECFYAPGNHDAYLKSLFGDYMKLPESKTTAHRFN